MIPTDRRRQPEPEPVRAACDIDDDADEIRYSLTALGEAALDEHRAVRGELFRGFGPCGAVA